MERRSAPSGERIASAPAPAARPAQKETPGFSLGRSCPVERAWRSATQAPRTAKASPPRGPGGGKGAPPQPPPGVSLAHGGRRIQQARPVALAAALGRRLGGAL